MNNYKIDDIVEFCGCDTKITYICKITWIHEKKCKLTVIDKDLSTRIPRYHGDTGLCIGYELIQDCKNLHSKYVVTPLSKFINDIYIKEKEKMK